MASRRANARFTRRESVRLSLFGLCVLALHLLGWGLFAWYARRDPALGGLGVLAYSFGLRHAFDADHIAAIDNSTRKLLADGRRPLGVGFFFSLGHSTIVFGLAGALALAARSVRAQMPGLAGYGGIVGTGVSATFLWLIGILNLVVLLDIVRMYRALKRGAYDEERLEARLAERGLVSRLLRGRLFGLITRSWHAYPLGVLFGLGFDTATEVALLALAAGAASHAAPLLAVLSLPILFAAGMSLMDTADGAFMSRAYDWAFASPARKIYYSLTMTSLSVAVALVVGSVEVVQLLARRIDLPSGGALAALNFENLGYGIVALFVLTWGVAALVWKTRRIEARLGEGLRAAAPE